MTEFRTEADSLGMVNVPADKLWGAQTQRSLEHFSIGQDLIPREMIIAYAILKKAAANANHASGRIDDPTRRLIVHTCDEILAGHHHDMFPLHVWMAGSGTQFKHECQRGDFQPLLSTLRHCAREQNPGASERSREHVAILKRHLSLAVIVHRSEPDRHQRFPSAQICKSPSFCKDICDSGARPDPSGAI